MSQSRRKVVYARLHEAYQQPGELGLGSLPKALSSYKAGGQPGIVMWWTPEGLEVEYKNAYFIIPLANVVGATFDNSEK